MEKNASIEAADGTAVLKIVGLHTETVQFLHSGATLLGSAASKANSFIIIFVFDSSDKLARACQRLSGSVRSRILANQSALELRRVHNWVVRN